MHNTGPLHPVDSTNFCSDMQTQTRRHANTQTRKHANTQTRKHTNTQSHKNTKSQTHKHTNTQTHKVTNTKSQTRTQKPRNAFLPDPELKKCAQEAGSVSHICISSFNYYRNRKNFYTIQNNTSYYRVWWPIYRCINIP